MAEFEQDIPVKDIVIRDADISSAVEDPLRANILDMLSHRAMTISEIHESLERRGYDRTENTARHHVNALRDADLVEIARLEEGRGGTRKYYKANTVVLSYGLPEAAEEVLESIVTDLHPTMAELLEQVCEDHHEAIDSLAAQMAPCEHCQTQKYEEYLLLTIVRRALVRELRSTTDDQK